MDENYNNNSGDDSSNSFDSLNSDYSYNSYDSADTGSDMPDISGNSYTADILSSVSRDNDNISAYNYGYDSMNNPSGAAADFSSQQPAGDYMGSQNNQFDTQSILNNSGSTDTGASAYNYGNSASAGNYGNTDASQGSYSGPAYDPTNNGQYTYDPVSGTYVQNQSTGGGSYSGANTNAQSGYTTSGTDNTGTYTYGYNAGYDSAASQKQGSVTAGVISLVTGILSLVCCCFGCTGVLFGLIAVICGIVHLSKKNTRSKGLGVAGIITGVLGFILGIIMLVGYATGSFDAAVNDFVDDSDIIYDDHYNYDYDYDYDYDSDADTDSDFDIDEFFNSLESEFDFDNNNLTDDSGDLSSDEDLERVYGTWRIDSGTGSACYVFNATDTWGWYKDYNDMNDNYYAGSRFEILSGNDAFDYYGMDEAEASRLEVDKDRFFCLKLYVDTYISGGVDKSEQYNGENPLSVALYLDKVGNEAILVNMDSADQYNVEKIN
ncbi:MAG: DUF4190 domain-containing protein [Lachnospiraceae bacterium]|nr:DUF4190 domain-containing protein [Lachnospiraceae bacterium]